MTKRTHLHRCPVCDTTVADRCDRSQPITRPCGPEHEVPALAAALLARLDTLTTEDFRRGADRDEREALRRSLTPGGRSPGR